MEPASRPTAEAAIGPYRALTPLAEGAFSLVYRATSVTDDRPVVLKLAKSPTHDLRREFDHGARWRHPHLGEVLDHGRAPDGCPYLVLAAHDGEPLSDQRGPWPESAVAALALQLARALATIHAEGLIHRDLSPANVLVDAHGHARLIDFGLVAPTGEAGAPAGTPLFLAPEAIAQAPVDARADLYALGALLYRQACGQAPFEELDGDALIQAVLTTPPPPITERAPQLSSAMAGLIMRLLAKEPADRLPSATDLAQILRALAAGPLLPGHGAWQPTPAFEAWRRSESGIGAFIGEPGCGRTRHLREAFLTLRRDGRPAVRLTAEPGDAPFALVERLWRWASADAATDRDRAVIASLWPWTYPSVSPEPAPDRLMNVLATALADSLRAQGPLTLLIDNWDATDAASRTVLESLWRERDLRWLLAGTEAPEAATVWPLSAMAPDEAGRWLASCLQVTPPARLVEPLIQASGGKPGWMQLALAQRAGDTDAVTVPASVEALLADTWSRLSAPMRQLAEALAVYAQPVRPDELAVASALLPPDWPIALGGLVEAGVLARQGDVHRFRHGWWLGFITGQLAPDRLDRLSDGLARALEAHWRPVEDPQRLHRLATLYTQGGEPEAIVRTTLAAGQALARVYANEAAAAHFAAGLAAIDAHADPRRFERDRRALLLGRADVQRLTGRLAEAVSAYEACLQDLVLPSERARVLVSLGKARQMLNRFEGAKEALEEAIALLGPGGAAMERLRALTSLGRVLHFLGDRDASLQRYEEALALGRAEDVPAFVAEALSFIGTMRVAKADTAAEGLQALFEALSIREAMGDQLGRNDTHMLLGNALFSMGRYQEAVRHFEANRAIAASVGHHQEEGFAHLNLALCELELGDWPRAAASLEAARRLARLADDAFLLGLGAAFESLAWLHLGDMAAMEERLAEAREREAAQANPVLRLYGLLVEAERHLFLGSFEHARRAAELAIGLIAKGHEPEQRAKAQLLLAEAWAHQGHGSAAHKALEEADAALSASGAAGPRGLYGRVAGWLAYRRGHRDEARQAWSAALAVAVEQGMAHLETQLRLHLHLLDRHEAAHATSDQDLERAYALAERLHAPEPLALGCLALGVRQLDAGQELFAERLFRRGHELLGLHIQALGSPGAKANFLAHPARSPFCEIQELEEAHQLQRRSRRSEMLLELGRAIGATRDPDGVLEQVRTFTLEVTQAERCLILLTEPGGWRLFGPEAPYSHTIVRRVEETRESACVLDTRTDDGLRTQVSILDLQVRAVMCVPLIVGGKLHGALYVDSQVALGAFTPEDLRCLEAIAKQAAVALDNAQLHQALAEQLRRQADYIRRLEESEHVIRHLEELDRVRGEYFQAASHDLRAPLASINVSCQALLKGLLGPISEDQTEAVEGVHHSSKSLMSLIDGILDAAKLEAGKLILHAKPVAVAKPVGEAVRLLSALASGKGLTLRHDAEALQALPPVPGDERRLQQVVLNLLSNAIKFTDQGHVAVGGRATEDGVVLWVSDTGPGLPAERLEGLFERYGASESGAIAGSGLGLWLVKGLVDLHHGRLDVESQPGQGTTFRIYLPAAPTEAKA